MSQNELHVVFGTGALGKWTARELVKMGKTVRMVNRSGRADRIPAVEVIASDAYDSTRNVEITKGAHAIYQCTRPEYTEWADKFPPLQKAIMEAAMANHVKLIVGDNLYMYGHFTGRLREDSAIMPNSKKGEVRAQLAQAVLDAHKAGNVRAAIGRASNFFGPDDYALTNFAIRPATLGKAVNLLGRMDQPHTFSYAPDFGKLLATLGTRDEALGQIWFTPSAAPVTQAELVAIMEAELGHKIKVMLGGEMMMRFLGLFNPTMRETVEMMYEWTKPFVVDTSKAEKAFGLHATSLKDAMRATIEWCEESK